jgi:hypothetical protein
MRLPRLPIPPSKKLHQERLHCRAVKVLEAPQLAWTEIPVANRKWATLATV